MGELPSGWTQVPLGELGKWRGGGTPSKAQDAFWTNGSIPWVSPKDMKQDVVTDAEDHITEAAVDGSATQMIPSNSILVVVRSGILRHTLPVATNAREVAINQDLKALTPFPSIEARFIAAQLRADAQKVLSECAKSGTTVQSIDFDLLKAYQFRIAPLSEQRRIVTKLDQLMSRTARARLDLDRIPALILKCKQAILDTAYHEFPGRQTLQELVDPLRGIPYGIVQTGEPTKGGVPTVRGGDIKQFKIGLSLKLVDPEIERNYTRTRLQGGEVLIAIRGSVGEPCVVPAKMRGHNISREVAMIPVRDTVDPRFIMFFLSSSEAKDFILGKVKGVAQQGINLEDLRNLPTPSASLEKQTSTVARIGAAFAWLDTLGTEHGAAAKLLPKLEQALLAKAFQGKLVPQDPNDEPASVLMQRIRNADTANPQQIRARKPRSDTKPRTARERATMAKYRSDEDVNSKPYLAQILRQAGGSGDAAFLFKRSELAVADFYKQLAWEIEEGHIRDDDKVLAAA